jgi:DHA2 family multidrug resistance protein
VQQHIEIELRPRPQPGFRGAATVAAGVLALLLDGSVTAVTNAGLPYLQGRVAATADEASWLITAFNACYYAAILLSPWLFVRFGPKRLLLMALSGFALVSISLIFVTSLPLMIVLRAVQGCFQGAIFLPAALLMFFSFPVQRLPLVIPSFALIVLGAGTVGSLVGGYFGDTYGGGSVFIPGALATILIAILVAWASLPDEFHDPSLRFDFIGVALSLTLFGSMQYLANEGERRNWFDSAGVIDAAILLAFSAPLFVLWELRTRFPHVNFTLFSRFHNLSVGAGVNVVVGMLGYSVTALVAYTQTSLGFTPELAGSLVLVRLLAYFFGVPAAYLLVAMRILDVRVVVSLAAAGIAVSFFGFAHVMTTTAEFESFIAISLIFGFFFSMASQPTPSLVVGGLPPALLLGGFAIYKVSSPIGLMIGTAIVQTFTDHRAAFHASILAAATTWHQAGVQTFLSWGGRVSSLAALVASQSTTLAFADSMRLMGALTLLVIPVVSLVRVAKPLSRQATVAVETADRTGERMEVGT